MNSLRRLLLRAALFLAASSAWPSGVLAFDNVQPSITNFLVSDCQGNLQPATQTTTGTPNIQFAVQDTTSGLRIGRSEHVGGLNGDPGLVLLLHFNSGAFNVDSSAFNNTVTIAGPTQVPGQAGFDQAANFVAGNSIQINASAALNSTTGQITIQAWIDPSVVNATERPIFEWNNGAASGVLLSHSHSAAGDLFADIVDTDGVSHQIVSPPGKIGAGSWQLVTLSYVANIATLYLNDVQIASTSFAANPPLFLQTGYNAFVGRRPSAGVSFLGTIDEVRIRSQSTFATQVESDFYSGKFQISNTSSSGPYTPGLLLATDYSPAASNGTVVLSTVAKNSVALAEGSNNFVRGLFQDMAGNVEEQITQITVHTSPPTSPTNLQGSTQTPTSLLWTWNTPSKVCLSSAPAFGPPTYNVYFATNAVPPPEASAIISPLQFLDTNLSTNTLYGRRVSAVDAFGESPLSPATSAYTLAAPSTGFAFTSITTGSFVVNWSTNGNPSYTRWELSFTTDPNFGINVSTPIAIANNFTGNSANLPNLAAGTTYYVRVRAENGQAADNSGIQFTVFLASSVQTLPPPTTLSGFAQGTSSITWSWTPVASATSYTLIDLGGATLFDGTALTFTEVGLATNTSYGAQVRVNNLSGSSLLSNQVTLFTLAAPPTGTTIVGVSSISISLVWNPDTNPNGTLYQVAVATDISFGGQVNSQTLSTTNVVLNGLLPGTTYAIHVRAYDGDGIPTLFDVAVTTVTGNLTPLSSVPTPPTVYTAAAGTVALYHFDESTGTVFVDSSGYANNGTLTCLFVGCSTPVYVAGMSGLGTAVQFPGIQNTLGTVPNSPSLQFGGSLTVEAWVNLQSLSQVNRAGIVAKGMDTDVSLFALDISANQWRFVVNDAGGIQSSVSSTQAIQTGQWTHVVGVYFEGVGTSSMSIFINGTLSNSLIIPGGITRGSNTHPLTIGSRQSGTGVGTPYDLSVNGIIDEVHLLTTALSPSAVAGDYAAGKPATVFLPPPNQGTCLTLAPDALRSAGVIVVSSDPVNFPIAVPRQVVLDGLSSLPSGQTLIPGTLMEVVAEVGGFPFTGTFGSSVTLCENYPDSNNSGLVDRTFPPVEASKLAMYTLNSSVIRWDALPSTVDKPNKRVLAQTIHFSVFALFGPTSIRPNLNTVRLYPVPWKPGSGGRFDSVVFNGKTGIAFDNLPISGSIRIFTLAAELVVELPFNAINVGTVIWDGKNQAGRDVASGVYFAYIKSDDGTSLVLKLAIER